MDGDEGGDHKQCLGSSIRKLKKGRSKWVPQGDNAEEMYAVFTLSTQKLEESADV